MIARIQRMKKGEGGFTLIELLVVMIIIGILAAIAIPVFLSQRAKAQDSATKADASTLGKEVATHYVDNSAAPTIVDTGDRYTLDAADIGASSQNVVFDDAASTFGTATTWCVELDNAEGSAGKRTWSYSAANGLRSVAC